MKIKIMKIVLVVCLMAMMAFLNAPTRVEAAGEDMSSATEISFGEIYDGYFLDYDIIIDWYKIVVPSSGRLSIKLSTETKCIRYQLYNNDCTDTIIKSCDYWDPATKITNTKISKDVVAGTYYFVVQDGSGDSGYYETTFYFESGQESFVESQTKGDNTRSTANKIQFGTKYKGFLANYYDKVDYYTFSLSKPCMVKLSAQAQMYGVYYELYSGNGEKVWDNWIEWDSTTKKSDYSESWELDKGKYYFVVNRDAGNSGKYSFKLTKVTSDGWEKVSGKKYYYVNGEKQKGWKKIGSLWYYFNKQGVMQTGSKNIDGERYYFKNTGEMVTGFRKISGKYYYFKKTGVMAKGFLKIEGRWYYFKKTGIMATNWLKIKGKWYYFGTKGSMAIGKKIKLGSKVYKFNSTGVCLNP